MATSVSSERQRQVRDAAHDRLDRALAKFTERHGVQWESSVVVGACVECAEGGHPTGECVVHCKAVAEAWANVEFQQAVLDDALLTEALNRKAAV